jgi:cysteine-S-conjugate beta-lyase
MSKDWKTRLIHSDAQAPQGFQSLVSPVYRGSTILFNDAASAKDHWNQYETGYSYGLYGTATTLELAVRICELEKGFRTIITAGGQGAISLVHLALLKSGDHVLLPESVYTPNRKFVNDVLRRFAVEASYYPPTVGPQINTSFRPNTRLVWCESPGSITMEVQDVPAIVEQAHRHGALVALDNTWSSGIYFDAFAHGVDVTMQALTKYVGGHSDLLLGSATTRDPGIFEQLGETYEVVGNAPSPDDCSQALRGMKTLAVRLKAIGQSALEVAQWLQQRPEIQLVLHPALPSCPGHEFWQRDFTGSTGLFSIVFHERFTREQVIRFIDALQLFKIGFSWGGVASLAMFYDLRSPKRPPYGSRIVRLYIGLESVDDLKADLSQALEVLQESGDPRHAGKGRA